MIPHLLERHSNIIAAGFSGALLSARWINELFAMVSLRTDYWISNLLTQLEPVEFNHRQRWSAKNESNLGFFQYQYSHKRVLALSEILNELTCYMVITIYLHEEIFECIKIYYFDGRKYLYKCKYCSFQSYELDEMNRHNLER